MASSKEKLGKNSSIKERKGSKQTPGVQKEGSYNHVCYEADDFNFTGYDLPRLVFLCEHRLVLRTRFPKLVVELYHHPHFAQWANLLRPLNHTTSPQLLVSRLVDGVNRHSTNAHGDLVHTSISLDDTEFLANVQHVMTDVTKQHNAYHSDITPVSLASTTNEHNEHNENIGGLSAEVQENHETNVLRKVHHTLKSLHWKDTSLPQLELDVYAPANSRRTRKRGVGGEWDKRTNPPEPIDTTQNTNGTSNGTAEMDTKWPTYQTRTIEIT